MTICNLFKRVINSEILFFRFALVSVSMVIDVLAASGHAWEGRKVPTKFVRARGPQKRIGTQKCSTKRGVRVHLVNPEAAKYTK